MNRNTICHFSSLFALVALPLVPVTVSGQMSGQDRERAFTMLEQVRKDIEKNYYDPGFNGLDLAAEYETARRKIGEVSHITEAFGAIAQFVGSLEDSHTVFVPPGRTRQVHYGFSMGFVGDTCFVTDVKEDSYAEGAGLKPGDALINIGPFRLDRASFPLLAYMLYLLSPQSQLDLFVRRPNGEIGPLTVVADVEKLPVNLDLSNPHIVRFLRERVEEEVHVYVETRDGVLLWKMPSFDVGTGLVDDMIKRARKGRALVIDMRGNPGGRVKALHRLIAGLFEDSIPVSHMRTREAEEEVVIEPRKNPFLGDLVLLVNSESASASEILARTVQIAKRGVVIGDRTAGAVMTSRGFAHDVGFGRTWKYAVVVSISDYIMADGKSLENVGVVPDEIVLPSGLDLREGRDPALSRALELVGIVVDPAVAARVFERK